ncbi:copper amine oxidase N-terminal domain-containing protein [Brevibacillus migulae]|uniref:copper amine oxidase N-terminal domain-containing protein n=1 Tax=Brevibacillus migulae TaxID=1644114 RepID=UPI00106ECEFC|nr:copper amine oxidase N-terminal domain-containing protein [Brevibacillus migulae]
MKKGLLSLVTFSILGLFLHSSTLAAPPNEIRVTVDGKGVNFPDSKPFLDAQANRTMVPVRFVSQALGATVDWDSANQTVKINRQGKAIALRIGEKKATVNGQSISFDAAAQLHGSRTFVPLRFISEAYGAQVEWRAPENLVAIRTTQSVIKDDSGKNHPVNESDPTFQAFHKSLQIKNGVLSGTVPKSWASNIRISSGFYFKDGRVPVIMETGGSFSYKVNELEAFGIVVLDTKGKGKRLAVYSYRNLPSLTPVKVVD